jgi:hypothetical protein
MNCPLADVEDMIDRGCIMSYFVIFALKDIVAILLESGAVMLYHLKTTHSAKNMSLRLEQLNTIRFMRLTQIDVSSLPEIVGGSCE